jgi:hypothetical protein
MASLAMSAPDVSEFKPSLVLLLWDGFTGANVLAGDVVVKIGKPNPLFQITGAEFVFCDLADGSYTVHVESTLDEPYYVSVDIPITLPFPRPAGALWDPVPVWPGYPDIVLADPDKMLSDPGQTAAYLGQRSLATLSPTTAYPFPVGATLARGLVSAAGVPLSGALVTTSVLSQPGKFLATIVTPAGVASAAQSLSVVQAPVIDSLDPPVVIAGAANFTLIAEGSGFLPGATLKWNGTALPTTFLSSGGLAAQINAALVTSVAQVTVVAVNPDGTASSSQRLMVASAPAITSIDPPSVAAGSLAFTLRVYGSGFAPPAVVELGGAPLPTQRLSSTQLSAQVAASQVGTASQKNVQVMNPGPRPQSSNVQVFKVVSAPVINFLEPAAVVAGSPAFALTVAGSGFDTGATVKLGGTALPTQLQGPNELTAQITGAQVGAVGRLGVTVSNTNGATSNTQTLIVAAAPAITSLEPGTVAAGRSAFTLVVRGSGFMSGSAVELNGTALSTTFVDSTELDVHVPRSGYTTGTDGTFVLFFDDVGGQSQTVTVLASHPKFPKAKHVVVTVLRGATVSANIDITS